MDFQRAKDALARLPSLPLGDVPSPALVGAISDARSLAEAVLIIPIAVLVSDAQPTSSWDSLSNTTAT